MDPDEHVPYLQEAWKRFSGLVDPQTGQGFRELGELPRGAFPREPDEATKEWHENVFLKRLKDDEERAAKADEKLNGVKPENNAPGGGTSPSIEEDGITLDDDIEDNETMKGEGLRTPYSADSKTHSRASSASPSYCGTRGRSMSPLQPPEGVDPERLYPQRHSYSGHRYSTPEPVSDLEDHTRSKPRKSSHVQYVYGNDESRPADGTSVRSVSPSDYGAATSTSHHPSSRRKVSGERAGTRGRSAEPWHGYYSYGAYRAQSRGDSHSPVPGPRSKSHGGPSVRSSTESLDQGFTHYNTQYNGPLPPMSKFVYAQEVSPSGMSPSRPGQLRQYVDIPAEYYQIHASSPPSSTAHPLTAVGGSRALNHNRRGNSPHGRGPRRVPSGGHGMPTARSGPPSRYQSSTDSLAPPEPSSSNVPPTSAVPPPKPYQPVVLSESEDDYAHYGTPAVNHHPYPYTSTPNVRPGSGASTVAAGAHRKSARRERERERDRIIDSDRTRKMQQMDAGGLGLSTEEEVIVGGRRDNFARAAAGGSKGGVASGGSGGRVNYVPAAGGVTTGGYSPYIR